ncbi:MAG TPA: glycosyltransferase family 2 protein [Thermomicrobiaceae bacterium]|nr:glycosyltransferase family 2 protein [Thermomicrobiaceae bacterium]
MGLTVSVIIVSYNGWRLLPRTLDALERQSRQADEIVVVDNGSSDGTLANLRDHYPAVICLDAEANLGFAAGNNLGVARSSGEVLVLLNNDAVPEADFLAELVQPIEVDPTLGSTAATMVFSRDQSIVASAGIEVYRNGLALDRGLGWSICDLGRPAPVFGTSAGAAAYRRMAWEDAGGFAEPFWMYLEDVDLAWRLRLRGWETLQVPRAIAVHDYSASAVEGSALKRRLLARNRNWTIVRCWPAPLLARHAGSILAYDLMAAGYGAVARDWAVIGGRLEAIRSLGLRQRERAAIQRGAAVEPERLERWLLPSPPPGEVLRLRRLTGRLASQSHLVSRRPSQSHNPRDEC